MSIRILFITDNFPPEVNAPATRTYEHCIEWVAQGAKVTVLTCFPNYPQGIIYSGYKNKLYQVENIDGIRVIRLWSFIAKNEGFLKRIIDYNSFALMSFFAGLFKKTDVIVATSPQFFTTLTGFFLNILKRKPWVFELRDLWPDTIRAVNAMGNEKVLDWLEKLELFLYRRADLVIAVTEAFKTNLVNRGIDARKIKVVTNGSNLSKFKPIPKDSRLINELGLNNKFVVGYIGTHGMTHNLPFIIECIREVQHLPLHFLFVGDGAEKQKIVELAKQLSLNNVTFLDPVSKEEINRYISITDVALVPLAKRDTFKTVIPSKIFESAAMEKPILLGVHGQAQEIVEQYGAGLVFEPENKTDFIEKLIRISTDKNLYSALQEGCSKLSVAFDRKMLATQMLDMLKQLQRQ